MAKEKKAAVDLQKMINETRDRKKAQDTADKIFGKKAAPTAPKKANGASGPVSTRAGVNKRVVSSKAVAKPSSLAARTSGRGGAASTRPKPNLRANRNAQSLANALFRENQNPGTAQVSIVNIRKANGPRRGGLQVAGAAARAGPRPATGLTIKGLAGPHVVEVRGFAPGTTAADVEQATRNQGIAVHSCQLIRTSPTVDADLTCETKEDADRVHGVFHNKETDYDHRTGISYTLTVHKPRPVPASDGYQSQLSQNNGILVDGSMGFEPMAVDDGGNGGLYSDQLVGSARNTNSSRRGRGFRGGRGGNNR